MTERLCTYTARVGAVIRAELAAQHKTQTDLAESVFQRDKSVVSKTLAGKRPLTLEQAIAVEDYLGRRRGFLLRAAGLIDEPRTVREWIETDVRLHPDDRRTVLRVYDACATDATGSSIDRSKGSSPSTQPTTRRTRRS